MTDFATTSGRLHDLGLTRATLLVDRARAEANIARFTDRAERSHVVLRPHFKTHQSAAVGEWFRTAGVDRATVSSVGQARYFADHGWRDLTLAMSANPREIADYDALAARIDLGLLADHPHTIEALDAGLHHPVRLWLEIDTGYGRTGVPWDKPARMVDLARRIAASQRLSFAGLLTHAGQSYRASDPASPASVFASTRERLLSLRGALVAAGLEPGLLSAGDTPGFTAARDWSGLDEARPGNFVFHDLMQLATRACTDRDLACAVACPVIGVYPERGEAVLHAGAVHLSREYLDRGDHHEFGRLLALSDSGFGGLVPGWRLTGLSQEHGVLGADDPAALDDVRPGDMVLVAPVHACLTCEQFGAYRTLDGRDLPRYRKTDT